MTSPCALDTGNDVTMCLRETDVTLHARLLREPSHFCLPGSFDFISFLGLHHPKPYTELCCVTGVITVTCTELCRVTCVITVTCTKLSCVIGVIAFIYTELCCVIGVITVACTELCYRCDHSYLYRTVL